MIFIHSPRTGGGSFERYLSRACKALGRSFHHMEGQAFIHPRGPRKLANDCETKPASCYFGHVHFGIHERLGVPPEYLALTRDPVNRVVSQLRMWTELEKTGGDMLGDILDNIQVRMWAGTERRELCTQTMFEEAADHMVRYSIARADHPETLRRRMVALGWPDLIPPGVHISTVEVEVDRDRIAEREQFDAMLHDLNRTLADMALDSLPRPPHPETRT